MKNNNYLEIYFEYWVPSVALIAISPYLCDLLLALHSNIDNLFHNKIFNILSIVAPGWHSEVENTIFLLENKSAKRYIYGIYASIAFLVFLHYIFYLLLQKNSTKILI